MLSCFTAVSQPRDERGGKKKEMPPSLPTTKNVVALSFMEQCRCSCYQRWLLQHSTRDKSHAMTGESVITGLSLWLKADGSISPPLQNPRVHIS